MDLFRKPLLVALVATVLFAVSLTVMQQALERPAHAQHATVLPEPAPLPEFQLTDQAGRPFGKDRLRGKFSLLFFGFTHCPDICPATLQQLVLARNRVAAATAVTPNIVLISVDPGRDTPPLLAEYVASFGNGIVGVTGEIDELQKLTSALGIFFEKSQIEAEAYQVAHTAAVLLVNERAELAAIVGAPHSIDAFVNDLPLLMASR